MEFEWDAANEGHLARHGVSRAEAEEALGDPFGQFNMPHFETEAEEADWWYDHRKEHDVIMAKAMQEGRTMTMKQVLEKHRLEAPLTSIPLDAWDVRRAQKQADARGVDAEVYIRGLLHEALMKSDAA